MSARRILYLLLSKRIDLPGQGYGPVDASPTGKNIVDVHVTVSCRC